MAETATHELQPGVHQTPENTHRRTDDALYNVRYLYKHIVDRRTGQFASHAEADVLEQDLSETAEADIHHLGVTVHQELNEELGQYISLGGGTVDNNINGCTALDVDDERNLFEFYRRVEEVTDEVMVFEPAIQHGMRRGLKKVMISPSPTHHEGDPDVASEFGYDDRTMIRIQSLSADGRHKTMKSFSVFGVPAKAWAEYFKAQTQTELEPTALAVMQHCNAMDLIEGSTGDVLEEMLTGVMAFVNEPERELVERQLDAFLRDQESLLAQALYYAQEKLAFEKELALSLNTYARPAVARMLDNVWSQLKQQDKQRLAERTENGRLHVDEYVARLALSIKTVMINNRAGLATRNERTFKRVAHQTGLEQAISLSEREYYIQMTADNDFMVERSEMQLAESGASCGGGCSVAVVDVFSKEAATARQAGISGKLYESSELDRSSKCGCARNGRKAKVLTNGKSVICFTCGEFKKGGQRGTLNKMVKTESPFKWGKKDDSRKSAKAA